MLYALRFIDVCFFFFKQKTAYEMRISDWSSDVCASDLLKELHRLLVEEWPCPVRDTQAGRSILLLGRCRRSGARGLHHAVQGSRSRPALFPERLHRTRSGWLFLANLLAGWTQQDGDDRHYDGLEEGRSRKGGR